MHPSDPAFELFAEYRELHSQDRVFDSDELRSLRFFAVDLAFHEGRTPEEECGHVASWVIQLRELEKFALREGRLPRENNRLNRDGISEEERILSQWSRDQRRPKARIKHCRYQTLRLETVPGFVWSPLDSKWQAQFEAYFRFVDRFGAPAIRSRNPEESRIAAWAARQRLAHAKGKLTPARVSALEATGRWVWTVTNPTR